MTRVLTPAELAALTPQAAHDMASTVLESAVYWAGIATGDAVRTVVDTFGRDPFEVPQVGDRFLNEGHVCIVSKVEDMRVLFAYPGAGGNRRCSWMWRGDLLTAASAGDMLAIGVAPAMVAGVGTP